MCYLLVENYLVNHLKIFTMYEFKVKWDIPTSQVVHLLMVLMKKKRE